VLADFDDAKDVETPRAVIHTRLKMEFEKSTDPAVARFDPRLLEVSSGTGSHPRVK
jgi:hypothetical protein